MKRGVITLKDRENKRARVLGKVDRGEMTAVEAGEVTGLSERHIRRLLASYREEGPKALAHGNRGRKPRHALDPDIGVRIVELAQKKYVGFNHLHFTEKLEGEEIHISYSSVRRILSRSGIKSSRKRRAPKHRSRRARRPQRGMMLQIDGSRHDWLEGRGPYLTLVGGIDDATGDVPGCLFREQEDAQGYFLLLQGIIRKHGLPMSLYSDRHGIFVRSRKERPTTIEEELRGEEELTQFGRALKELEIQAILALSPQAKGRVERLWGTFQDRLVSELRLAGAKTLTEANEVLEKFLVSFNRRFVVEPKEQGSAYRPLPVGMKLSDVLCFKYQRTVNKDNTVQLEGRIIDIPPGPGGRSYAKAKVIIHERMDGSLEVKYKGQRIAYEEPTEDSPVLRVKHGKARAGAEDVLERSLGDEHVGKATKAVTVKGSGPLRPAPDHPWRKHTSVKRVPASQPS